MKYYLFLIILISSVSAAAEKYTYDPQADPYQLLVSSVEKAKNEDKLILVVFGSDWCPDCRSFNKKLGKNPLSKTIKSKFIVMHVDVGEWDKNIPFTEEFGKPIDGGIPSIAILGTDQSIYYVAEGGEFASARTSKVKSINGWFISVASEIAKISSVSQANKGSHAD
jgi:thiol-disulfide isomerase/thioredoxin